MDTGFLQKVGTIQISDHLMSAYNMKGFSADVAAAVLGYVIGGNAYFSIPWAFDTIVGLAALALEQTPAWPTYHRVSLQQSD
jgi:hypothetical protein